MWNSGPAFFHNSTSPPVTEPSVRYTTEAVPRTPIYATVCRACCFIALLAGGRGLPRERRHIGGGRPVRSILQQEREMVAIEEFGGVGYTLQPRVAHEHVPAQPGSRHGLPVLVEGQATICCTLAASGSGRCTKHDPYGPICMTIFW